MKRSISLKVGALAAAVGLVMSGGAFAADNDDQIVGYEVTAINEISISGDILAANLTVNAATAGSQPDPVTNGDTSYNITTNGTAKKITAVLNEAMGTDLTLAVTPVAPTGATAGTEVVLTDSAAEIVTGITQVAEQNKTLTYKLTALVTAGVVAATSKTVTMTITD